MREPIEKGKCATTKEEYINAAVSQIENDSDKHEAALELAAHIDDRIEYYKEIGFDEVQAAQKAVEQMGDPDAVAAAFSEIYPQDYAANTVFAVLGIIFLLFIIACYKFYVLGDGIIGFGVSELLRLFCIIELSILGKKRKNRFLCGLSIVVFLLTYPLQIMIMDSICSPLVLALFCILTGDFSCLSTYGRVGNITAAPWITAATCVFYLFILSLLIAASRSVRKLHQPTYSLYNKKMYRRTDRIQKGLLTVSGIIVCISLVAGFFGYFFGKHPTDPVTNDETYSFNTVVIMQSDTPCSLEEVDPADVLVLSPDLDFSLYFAMWYDRGYLSDIDTRIAFEHSGEFVRVACSNKLEYEINKEVVTADITKKYVYIDFLNDSSESPFKQSGRITVTESDWQEADSVAPICAAADSYNVVEVVINAS